MTSVDCFVPDAGDGVSRRVVAAYLDAYAPPGGLVLDPFCQYPLIIQEAVRSGRRVVATNLNPVDALRTRIESGPSPGRDLMAAVSRLGDSPRLGTSLQEHLQHLYRTTCPHCGKPGSADYFVWDREQGMPKQVSYRCPACGQSGLRDCDDDDLRTLQEVQPRGLHYSYILDRIAKQESRGRRLAERLLELYTPRNLYVLSNLVLKMDDLFAGLAVHDSLRLILLHCLELGSKLNPLPTELSSAHAIGLTPPPRFIERNVWQLFIDTARARAQPAPGAVPLAASIAEVVTPSATADGSPSVRQSQAFVGRMSVKQLVQQLPAASVDLVLTQPPQLGRTRWALPYLWSGWLYGHQLASSLWPLIRRRASDWPFYSRAMRATLQAVQKALTSNGRIVLLGETIGLALQEALTLAAAGADLRLQSSLYHAREMEAATKAFAGLHGDYRITWTKEPSSPPWRMPVKELKENIQQSAVAAAEEVLEQRGEPAPFARLHCAIWEALAQRNLLHRTIDTWEPPELPGAVRDQVKAALDAAIGRTLVQLWKDEAREDCLWWLVEPPAGVPPLTERVELAVRDTLALATAVETSDLLSKVYAHFPRGLTPDAEWVAACIRSYGQALAPERWELKPKDRPEQRAQVRDATCSELRELGRLLGYAVSGPGVDGLDCLWTRDGQTAVGFWVLDAVELSRVLGWKPTVSTGQMAKCVIIPEARHDLLHLKLTRFSWLRKQLASRGFQLLKDTELKEWAHDLPTDGTQLSLV